MWVVPLSWRAAQAILPPAATGRVLASVKTQWRALFADVHALRLPLSVVESRWGGLARPAVERELYTLAHTNHIAEEAAHHAWVRERADLVDVALRCCRLKHVIPKIRDLFKVQPAFPPASFSLTRGQDLSCGVEGDANELGMRVG